jgi:hypothetical protein
MDGEDKRGRARSFVLGGLVGASAAIATARRRRDVAGAIGGSIRPASPPSRKHPASRSSSRRSRRRTSSEGLRTAERALYKLAFPYDRKRR